MGYMQEPVKLVGLLGALKGHPSLTWLDASGHLVNSAEHDDTERDGSRALEALLHTAPNQTSVLLEDSSFTAPFGLIYLLRALDKSRIVKLCLSPAQLSSLTCLTWSSCGMARSRRIACC